MMVMMVLDDNDDGRWPLWVVKRCTWDGVVSKMLGGMLSLLKKSQEHGTTKMLPKNVKKFWHPKSKLTCDYVSYFN